MKSSDESSYLPTPAEVRRACRQIQDSWSPTKRMERAVSKIQRWMPPTIRTQDLDLGTNNYNPQNY